MERNFLLMSCLYYSFCITKILLLIIFPLTWFCSGMAFNTKYFVLSYSIVVVSTLSYGNVKHMVPLYGSCSWAYFYGKLTIIDSDNDLYAGIFLIGPLGTTFSEILKYFIEENTFANIVYEMLSMSSRPQPVNNAWLGLYFSLGASFSCAESSHDS